MSKFCKNCGKEVTGKFCESCGTAVEEESVKQEKSSKNATVTVEEPLKKKKNGCLWGIVVALFILAALIALATSSVKSPESASPSPEATEETDKDKQKENDVSKEDYKTYIKKVSKEESSATEKFDKIELYAKEYQTTEKEAKQFLDDIIEAYKNDEYLSDIENDKYMLTNIFKSYVVNKHYGDNNAEGDFAFDFYQNSKYIYRGVETIDSDSVKSNVKQMKKLLEQIEGKSESKEEEKAEKKEKLELLSYEAVSEKYSSYIVGKIKNNTNRKYSYVQIVIKLYRNDSVVATTMDNVNNLGAGETWEFKALVTDNDIDYYKIDEITGF